MRTSVIVAGVVALLARGAVVRADAPAADAPARPTGDDPFVAFPLTARHEKHYVRAGLEIGGILSVGLVDYLLNTTARGGSLRPGDPKWALRYDAELFRGKFTGDSYSWDTNRFGTNFATHPFAGDMYFTAARSNHLTFLESYAFAALGSSIWEYFGEIREINSINDMIVTPISGAAIGETTMQLAGFFDRGDARFSNRLASFLFAPWKFVNEGLDDEETVRSANVDGAGLPTEPWHRFALDAGGGVTVQDGVDARFGRATYADLHVGLTMDVANLPDYEGVGHWSRLYDDGNRAGMAVDATVSRGELVDGRFATRIVPLGYYYRDAVLGPDGRVRGEGALVGLRMGFEYGTHDWDRDRARPADVYSLVSPVGVAAEYTFERGSFRARTALDVAGSLAGITPYALAPYAKARTAKGLPTVTREQGYDYSLAVTIEPRLDLAFRTLHWRSSFRLDTFRGVLTMDESPDTVDTSIVMTDRRAVARSTLSWEPSGGPRLAVGVARGGRFGEIGPVRAERTERSLTATVGVVF